MRIRLFTPPGPLTYDMLNQRAAHAAEIPQAQARCGGRVSAGGALHHGAFLAVFAPYGKYERNLDYIYCPPQKLGFDGRRGCTPKGSGGWSIRSR